MSLGRKDGVQGTPESHTPNSGSLNGFTDFSISFSAGCFLHVIPGHLTTSGGKRQFQPISQTRLVFKVNSKRMGSCLYV